MLALGGDAGGHPMPVSSEEVNAENSLFLPRQMFPCSFLSCHHVVTPDAQGSVPFCRSCSVSVPRCIKKKVQCSVADTRKSLRVTISACRSSDGFQCTVVLLGTELDTEDQWG